MDKRFLEDCLAKGMSLPQIGELSGRPPGTVGYWVAKHGLVANGKEKFSRKGPLDREELERLLLAGMTLRDIASRLEVPISRVIYSIERHQLPRTARARRTEVVRAARETGAKEVELECPSHGLTSFWIGRTSVRCRKCNSRGVASRRRRVKEILVAEAGGKCCICGYDRLNRALEFHHVDPSLKSFGLGLGGVTRSIAAMRAEAAKCVLLCANCHVEVEEGLVELPLR